MPHPPAPSATTETATSQRTPTRAATAWTLGALLAVVALTSWQQTAMGIALPQIIGTFGQPGSLQAYTYTVSLYSAGFFLMLSIGPLLSRRIPLRWLLPLGFVGFLIGCALCGAARSMAQLDWYRAGQGLTGGLSFVLATRAGLAAGPVESRSARLGLCIVVYGLAAIMGPSAAHWVMEHGPLVRGLVAPTTSWRWVFYANIPVGLATLAVLVRTLPHARRHMDTHLA